MLLNEGQDHLEVLVVSLYFRFINAYLGNILDKLDRSVNLNLFVFSDFVIAFLFS